MPIYEYRRPDGTTFDVLQSFSDEPLSTDPESGVPVERLLSPPAVHFKGKGFYNTDYGTRRRQRENAARGDGGSGSSDSANGSGTSKEKKGSDAAGSSAAKDSGSSGGKDSGSSAKPAAAKE